MTKEITEAEVAEIHNPDYKVSKYKDSIEAADIAMMAIREFLRFDMVPTTDHTLEEIEKAQDDNGTQYWRVQISYRPDSRDNVTALMRGYEKIYKDVLIKADNMEVTAIKTVSK